MPLVDDVPLEQQYPEFCDQPPQLQREVIAEPIVHGVLVEGRVVVDEPE